MVHPTTGDIYVVTKNGTTGLSKAYKFPNPLPAPDTLSTLIFMADLQMPLGVDGNFRSVTAGTIHPCANRFLLRTYRAVYEYRAPVGGAEVWLVRFDARSQEVAVRRGDNRGQTLEHRNVVRQLVRLGPWAGRPRVYRLPAPPEDGLTSAILVQGAAGGAMIGVMVQDQEPKAEETASR